MSKITPIRSGLRYAAPILGLFALSGVAHSFFINDEQTVTPPSGEFTAWDASDMWAEIGSGAGATGSLTVPAGEEILFGVLDMGIYASDASGYLEITGEGAIARANHSNPSLSFLNVGYHGSGEVLVTNGGLLQTNQAYAAFEPGSTGSITVTGPESRWEGLSGSFRIGHGGEGSLHVLDGAKVEGHQSLFVGNVRVTDDFNNFLGAGVGEVLIEGGSTVAGTSSSRIANQVDTEGIVTVRGPGTLFSVGTFLHAGSSGTGTLVIEDGATVRTGTETTNAALSVAGDHEDAVGHVHITGEGSLLDVLSFIYVGRTGTGTFLAENGAYVRGGSHFRTGQDIGSNGEAIFSGPNTRMDVDLYMHVGSGGDGTLIIREGAQVVGGNRPDSTNSGISVPAAQGSDQENATGHVHVTGEGSLLETLDSWMIVGRGDGDDAEVGSSGTVLVDDGGLIRTGTYFRLGGNSGTNGEATVIGTGSAIEPGSFLQVGFNGTGTLLVQDGGRIEVPLDGGSISSAGRNDTGVGSITIEGEGSFIQLPRFLLGSDTALEPTGVANVVIRDGGELILGGHLSLRNGSTIELDNGTVTMVGGIVDTRPDVTDIGGAGSLITGAGTIDSAVVLSDGGSVIGTGDGIALSGPLFGVGTVENVTLGSIRATSSLDVLNLTDTSFAASAPVELIVDGPTEGIITFDETVDLSGAAVIVTFEPFEPSTSVTFPLFNYTGPGEAEYNFASVSTPPGWVLEDGLLHYTGEIPDQTPFEEWAAGYGLTGADAQPGANPAGDGHTNEAKFAFGVDPTVAVAALVDVSRDGDRLVLRWNRSTNAGIQYTIESRDSLTGDAWESVPGAEPQVMTEPDTTPPSGYERVEWSVDVSGETDAGFFRVTANVDPSLLP